LFIDEEPVVYPVPKVSERGTNQTLSLSVQYVSTICALISLGISKETVMGPWGIALLVGVAGIATETGRALVKKIVRIGLLTGAKALDGAADLAGRASAYKDELVSEIREEQAIEEAEKSPKSAKTKKHAAAQ